MHEGPDLDVAKAGALEAPHELEAGVPVEAEPGASGRGAAEGAPEPGAANGPA